MLRWRIVLGVLLIAALAGLMWLDFHASTPGAWLLGLALLVGWLAAREVVSLFAAGGHVVMSVVVVGGTLLVIASNALPLAWDPVNDEHPVERLGWPLLAFTLTVLAVLIGEIGRYREPGQSMSRVGLATFGVAYVGLLLSFAINLRVLGGPIEGMVTLIAMIIVVKMGDTGAYTIGRLFGRHKMAPRVSPGKTLEGAGGALLFACIGAWFSYTYIATWLGSTVEHHPASWIVFGLLVGLAGMVGDLAESLLKRDMGVKDSSTWMPGFGGVLDLLDSILFAAPVAFVCSLLGI